MTLYTGITLLTELFLLAMAIHVLRYSGISRGQKTWFLLTFLTVMLCAAAEYAVHGLAFAPRFALPLTVLTVLQFSAAPLLGILFSGALGVPRQGKLTIAFLGLNLLAEVIAAPFGGVFFFDEAGYHRGAFFIIYELFYFFSLIYLLVGMVRLAYRTESVNKDPYLISTQLRVA